MASAIDSPAVIRGSSDAYGSWNTICSGRRPRRGTGFPSSRIFPAVGRDQADGGAGEGRLPRPGLADEPDNVPGRHDEVDAVGGDVRMPPGAVPHGHPSNRSSLTTPRSLALVRPHSRTRCAYCSLASSLMRPPR